MYQTLQCTHAPTELVLEMRPTRTCAAREQFSEKNNTLLTKPALLCQPRTKGVNWHCLGEEGEATTERRYPWFQPARMLVKLTGVQSECTVCKLSLHRES